MRPLVLGAQFCAAIALLLSCHGRQQDGARAPASPTPKSSLVATAATRDGGSDGADASSALVSTPDVELARWAPIDALVNAAIAEGKLPGCVVVVGRGDGVVLERAYGSRSLLPERTPMTADTVFDLASLTKPVATAASAMVLVDRGKLDLDARASRYVPELARLPPFTVRQLLLHTSGLPAVTPLREWSGEAPERMQRVGALRLRAAPGERFLYSDVGYEVLHQIVERVSGEPLASFAAREVFAPLGMSETGFLPSPELRARTAPTEPRDGGFVPGDVHDPRAFAAGGVAGHAGLFSTARDLSRFARAMLGRGALDDRRVFSEETFARFVERQDTSKGGRALGWDVDSVFATHRSPLLSPAAFGHGGYTGTALWIDPGRDLFVLFLSNRVHPDGKGAVNPLVWSVSTLAADALGVRTGIDVLRAESFARLRGAHVGLVTNASARARDGTKTIDVLRSADGLTLEAIFTPEHGIGADREGKIADATYEGIPVRSLYGDQLAPPADALEGIDTLVVDLQDVGMRFYTYASTMANAMKAAAEHGLRFVVLDRPNPLGGRVVEGPVLAAADATSFVDHHALALRHGMTMGELARLFAEDDGLDVKLDVVTMTGWRRQDAFERTGLAWSAPSPNLPTARAATLYAAIGLFESTNVSVGRGTDMPFEIVAAPWIDGAQLAARLDRATLPGVRFEPVEVVPRASVHANKRCSGIRVELTDADRFEPLRTAVVIAEALHAAHPTAWHIEKMKRMLRHAPGLEAITAGKAFSDVEATWVDALEDFRARRARVLLYP